MDYGRKGVHYHMIPPYGGFLKWWYPQIIHFNRVFHYFHHPFWGFSPYFWFNTHIPPNFSTPCLEELVDEVSSCPSCWTISWIFSSHICIGSMLHKAEVFSRLPGEPKTFIFWGYNIYNPYIGGF